jgi:hypothetical protein
MTWTKLEWLPAAIRAPHPRPFAWTETTNPKGCLHTTETSGRAGYQGWTVMPHAEVLPTPGKGVEVKQFLPFSQASFALRHERAQPTNGDYVFQFELVGTCDRSGPGYFWPQADDAVLLDLYRKVIKPLDQAFLVPFKALEFRRYPDLAGTNRLSDSAFDTYTGWLGHQHVPQNSHGDPGAFPWARLAALAAADSKKDDKVTPNDIAAIADAVWNYKLGQAWDGQYNEAAVVLTSAQRYAIEAGFPGVRPKGNGNPGTSTTIKALADQLDAVKAGLDDLRRVVGNLQPGNSPTV